MRIPKRTDRMYAERIPTYMKHAIILSCMLILLCTNVLLLISPFYAAIPTPIATPSQVLAAEKKLDGNFDIRTKTTMTAENFNAKYANTPLKGMGEDFIKRAEAKGLNAGFVAGIMAWETGWGTSNMFKEIKNPGGLTCAGATPPAGATYTCTYRKPPSYAGRYWKTFKTYEDALDEKVAYLKRKYVDEGIYTISELRKIYCPDGDGCGGWLDGVLGTMKSLGEDGSQVSKLDAKEGGKEEKEKEAEQKVSEKENDMIPPSIFADYEMKVESTGVKAKNSYDARFVNYQISQKLKNVMNVFHVAARIVAVSGIAYLTLLWLAVLLARVGAPFTYEIVQTMTKQKIDPHGDIKKLGIISFVVLVALVIVASGYLAKIFQFIYYIISVLIEYLLYEL